MTESRDTDDDRREAIRMIRDSAAALIASTGGLARVRSLRFGDPGFDPAVYRQMAEAGWIGLLVPEDKGGLGLGMAELAAVCEEMGRGLAPEPLIPATLSASLLVESDRPELFEDAIAGKNLVVAAWQEAPDTLTVAGTADGNRLFVPTALGADAFLVALRDGSRTKLLLCTPDSVDVTRVATQDGGHYGTLHPRRNFGGAETIVADVGARLDRALEQACLATAAYLLGVIDAAFEMTLGYLKTRQQFGRPIGSFQTLQHRAADLKIQVALTRASVESAAATLDSDASAPLRLLAVSRAKARASDAAMLVTRQAIQMHGAIGYTDEYDVGLYLRKAMVLAGQYGSARVHRRRFMAAMSESDDE